MSRQRVVRFGSTSPLVGVLTEPATGTPRQPVAVLILNSGILHHVGASRLHVQLARRFAEAGFASLRFDFSGIGDSEPRKDHLTFEQSSPVETREAIDYLAQSHGLSKVVLMGLCSGADAAHLSATLDDRIVGLGMLDPWVYRTPLYYVHHYGKRMITPRRYTRWIRIRVQRLRDWLKSVRASVAPDADMYEVPEYLREFPPRESVAGDLRKLVSRGVELLVLFSGGLEEYNHLGQYRAAFHDVDFGSRLHEAHVPDAAHVFSAVDHQAIVINELSGWMTSRFGEDGSPSQAGLGARAARSA
jgi:pimeloyl-ACP methyl ester carboxylesterase